MSVLCVKQYILCCACISISCDVRGTVITSLFATRRTRSSSFSSTYPPPKPNISPTHSSSLAHAHMLVRERQGI